LEQFQEIGASLLIANEQERGSALFGKIHRLLVPGKLATPDSSCSERGQPP
jgi:hypothetical protein